MQADCLTQAQGVCCDSEARVSLTNVRTAPGAFRNVHTTFSSPLALPPSVLLPPHTHTQNCCELLQEAVEFVFPAPNASPPPSKPHHVVLLVDATADEPMLQVRRVWSL